MKSMKKGNTKNNINAMTEEEVLECLETAKKHAEQGFYKDANVVEKEMKEKFKL